MHTSFVYKNLLAFCFFLMLSMLLHAQDKEIAKVDEYIAKAKETDDPAKKNEYYNKAGSLIMSERLGKEQNIKIGDAYLEDGDIAGAARFYLRCDKEDKNEGYVKIGNKMIEQAFEDPKTESKTISKALSYFSKGGKPAEGYEAVGDAYYAQGKDAYMTAASYYGQGKIAEKVQKIANEYIAEGNNSQAAEVYLKLNDEEGFAKAGDLYYAAGDYNNAYAAYEKGLIADGIKKYADKLYEDGEKSSGDAMYTAVAEMYRTKNSSEGILALAKSSEERCNYGMAAVFYDKAGDTQNANRSRAYEQLLSFDFTAAKEAFEKMGSADKAQAVTANLKYLTTLKDASFNLDEVKNNQPYVSYTIDSVTKKKTPNPVDMESFNTYYKNAVSSIVDNCYRVSENITKISDPDLKAVLMKKFRQYGAIRNVLDTGFGKKLQKSQVTAKDVIL